MDSMTLNLLQGEEKDIDCMFHGSDTNLEDVFSQYFLNRHASWYCEYYFNKFIVFLILMSF